MSEGAHKGPSLNVDAKSRTWTSCWKTEETVEAES